MKPQIKAVTLAISFALAQTVSAAPSSNGGGSGRTVNPQGAAVNNPNAYVAPSTFTGGGSSVNTTPGTGGGANGPGNSYGPGRGAGQGCPPHTLDCNNGSNGSNGSNGGGHSNFNGGGNSQNQVPGTGQGANGPGNSFGPGRGAGQGLGCVRGRAHCDPQIDDDDNGTGGQLPQNTALTEVILNNGVSVPYFANNGREANGLDTLEFVNLQNDGAKAGDLVNVGELPPGIAGRTNVYLIGGGIKLK